MTVKGGQPLKSSLLFHTCLVGFVFLPPPPTKAFFFLFAKEKEKTLEKRKRKRNPGKRKRKKKTWEKETLEKKTLNYTKEARANFRKIIKNKK
ncbi:MAG: hypothetical protein WC492_02520 [Candidatus Micrarchaeia archaeon]